MPSVTISLSKAGQISRKRLYSESVQNPITFFHPCPVVPTAIEDHHFTRCRQMGNVALPEPLALFALGGCRQGDYPEDPRAHPLGDPLDDAALAGGLRVWMDPWTVLRVPLIFNLRRDPSPYFWAAASRRVEAERRVSE